MALNMSRGRSLGRIDIWAIFWDCQKVQGQGKYTATHEIQE